MRSVKVVEAVGNKLIHHLLCLFDVYCVSAQWQTHTAKAKILLYIAEKFVHFASPYLEIFTVTVLLEEFSNACVTALTNAVLSSSLILPILVRGSTLLKA